tara:strand:+ start:1069 stop:1401 length:333 start_codon:yes stop_codon:yes gene_type:complete
LGLAGLQQVQLPVNFNQYFLVIKAMILSLVIHLILLQQQVVALEEEDLQGLHIRSVVQVVLVKAEQLEIQEEQEILLLHVQLMEFLKEIMEEQVLALRAKLEEAVAVLAR